jgi:hypothetical protein
MSMSNLAATYAVISITLAVNMLLFVSLLVPTMFRQWRNRAS